MTVRVEDAVYRPERAVPVWEQSEPWFEVRVLDPGPPETIDEDDDTGVD